MSLRFDRRGVHSSLPLGQVGRHILRSPHARLPNHDSLPTSYSIFRHPSAPPVRVQLHPITSFSSPARPFPPHARLTRRHSSPAPEKPTAATRTITTHRPPLPFLRPHSTPIARGLAQGTFIRSASQPFCAPSARTTGRSDKLLSLSRIAGDDLRSP